MDPLIANAGTPLMWASMLHLFIGNAFIGLLEGLLLGWIYKVSKLRAVLLMVLANYISSWAGAVFLSVPDNSVDVTIYNIKLWMAGLTLLSFFVTVALELPCIALALHREGHPQMWGRALKASFLVHCISYVLLVGYYLTTSIMSLATELTLVPVTELIPKSLSSSTLYYIDPSGSQVVESKLDGSGATACGETFVKSRDNLLLFRQVQSGEFQLLLAKDPKPFEKVPDETPVIKTIHAPAILPQLWEGAMRHFQYRDLPAPPGNAWSFMTGSWAYNGIKARDLHSGRLSHYALETPFVAWPISDPIQLPGDFLLFQLGRDQICLLDPTTRRMALVTRGSRPVIVLQK